MKKSIIPITILACFSISSLLGCKAPANGPDRDYDGIINELDPAPDDNTYKVRLTQDGGYSQTMSFAMDYRNFLKEKYDPNLGLLGAYLINEFSATKPDFTPAYSPIADPASKVMAQVGCQDITYIDVASKYQSSSDDPYDVDNVIMGHNTFINENNTYQVFFVNNHSYVNGPSKGFMSDFDVGAETEAYQEFSPGEHSDWKDKNNHKGFDVTTNRILEAVLQYYDEHKIEDTKPIFFITGHSRGAAVANLMARSLIDKSYTVRAYAYNTPNNTAIIKSTVNDQYKTIFNILNDDDLISAVPTTEMGFHRFGQDVSLSVAKTYATQYKTFFGKEYHYCEDAVINALIDCLNSICTKDKACNRNTIYEYRDYHYDEDGTNLDAEYFDSQDSAEACRTDLLQQIHSYPSPMQNVFYVDEVKQDSSTSKWYVQYTLRPSILMPIIGQVMDLPEISLETILGLIESYKPFVTTLISDITTSLLVILFYGFDPDGIVDAHIQATSCFMAYMLAQANK